jgi:hypothetical protein
VLVEGPPPRRLDGPLSRRVERTIMAIVILGAIGWWPYMILWWMQNGWPPYPETYFVGLIVIPAAILAAGRGLVVGLRALRGSWG